MPPRLSDFRVLTFDCYGTLIDWETGIWVALQPLFESNDRADIARSDALAAFGHLEAEQEADHPGRLYPDILTSVHRGIAGHLGLETSPALDGEFGASVRHWPAFPDSVEALARLAERYRLVILSNVDNESFGASASRLAAEFDAVYAAEDIGSYKPDPANFEYLLAHLGSDLGLGASDVLHTAQSLFHDHAPAKALGLATSWIDRQRLSERGDWGATAPVENPPEPDFRFHSMSEMADAAETGQ
jgi:2-haloalkanoic acid dehalogenase type II